MEMPKSLVGPRSVAMQRYLETHGFVVMQKWAEMLRFVMEKSVIMPGSLAISEISVSEQTVGYPPYRMSAK